MPIKSIRRIQKARFWEPMKNPRISTISPEEASFRKLGASTSRKFCRPFIKDLARERKTDHWNLTRLKVRLMKSSRKSKKINSGT